MAAVSSLLRSTTSPAWPVAFPEPGLGSLLLTGPQDQLDCCWLQPPLGTACQAGHCFSSRASQLCRTTDHFWYYGTQRGDFWVRSSPIPQSLVSEVHGVFSKGLTFSFWEANKAKTLLGSCLASPNQQCKRFLINWKQSFC